jgi:hypothetical protein
MLTTYVDHRTRLSYKLKKGKVSGQCTSHFASRLQRKLSAVIGNGGHTIRSIG